MTSKKYLIIEDRHMEIENLTELGFDPETRTWCDVTINVKDSPIDKTLPKNTSDFYILKDQQLFFVKVGSFNVDDKTISVTPKWCTYLNL